jgi:DNA-binding transcriptional ArsR family regulator
MGRDFTLIGSALAASARSTMIGLLMDGSARPAGELAASAGVGASAASEHLAILVNAGLLSCALTGRQRFYRISTASTAATLEHLGHLCPEIPVGSLRQSRQQRDLALARLCYDHLAGRLAVALTDTYLARGWLEPQNLALTPLGESGFAVIGVDIGALFEGRRQVTRSCPDWTERRPHLAGAVGAAMATLFQERDWTRRRPSGRGLTITAAGAAMLWQEFGIVLQSSFDGAYQAG